MARCTSENVKCKRGCNSPLFLLLAMHRNFKGVWIPAEVWLDHDLSLVEKALLAEVDSFTGSGSSFFKSNEQIQKEYGVSRPTITRAINKLEKRGLITRRFDGRVRHLKSQAECSKFTGRVKDLNRQDENQEQAASSNDTCKTQRKNKPKNKIKLVFPFDTSEFHQAWDLWVTYKREQHNFKFKSPSSEQASLKKLGNLCNGNETQAISIIHESIANGWRGFWAPRQEKRVGAQDGSVITEYLQGLNTDG